MSDDKSRLEGKIRELTLKEMEENTLSNMGYYSRRNKKLINFLYKNKIIEDKDLESVSEKIAINTAKQDYSLLLKLDNYADHSNYPECLAYALDKKVFSKNEIKKIKFDHGDNLTSFIKDYSNPYLLSGIKEELLNPKPVPSFSKVEGYCSEHGTCFEGH
jgi:hypothetical protein